MTAELTCRLAAALELPLPLELVLLVPPVLPLLALALLEVQVNLPWTLPFPPWDSGAFSFRVVQSEEMSSVELTVKVPTTLWRAGNSTLPNC